MASTERGVGTKISDARVLCIVIPSAQNLDASRYLIGFRKNGETLVAD